MATEETETTAELSGGSTVVGGLEENVAGALAYLLGFITGVVFYLLEEDNEFVRFHAAQSMLVFGGLFVLSFGFSFLGAAVDFIPGIGGILSLGVWLLSLLLGPLGFVLWVLLLVKAYSGDRYKLPVVGDIAEGWV